MDRLPFQFGNAAGWPKTLAGVAKIAGVPLVTHIRAGSFAVQPRSERGGGTDFDVLEDGTASNNRNLPNGGIDDVYVLGRAMVNIAHNAGKRLIISGAPFSAEDDGLLAKAALAIGADGYESCRSCPNTEASIICFDHGFMAECDAAVDYEIGLELPWWRKVSPYVNPRDREIEAEQTFRCTARGIVSCNTFPGARLRRDGKPIITARGANGLGGMSGEGLRYVAQINIEHFCELLRGMRKEVIGVGGISRAEHVEWCLSVGCAGVQVAAALFKSEDPKVLQQLAEDWVFKYQMI